jgi:hypothetical protein
MKNWLTPGLVAAGLCIGLGPAAAYDKKPCALFLKSYREVGKTAEFVIALRCDGYSEGDNKPQDFPIGDVLVIGLTATSSDKEENDRAEIEYDFAVQRAVVSAKTTADVLTFHAQLSDIAGLTHVFAKAWPESFLQDCSGGRSGCRKFGYALAAPASLPKFCSKRVDKDVTETSDELACSASAFFRFKFR